MENKEWKEYTLLDFCKVLNHKRIPLSSMERNKRKGIFPYYGASGIIDFINDYIFSGKHLIISEDGENLKTRNTPIAFIANNNFWVNNHAHILKCNEDYQYSLLIYYFQNVELNPFLTGAVQPKLNKASLLNIPIFLPKSTSEQKAIAAILSSLDDKIDLLQQQNQTLETLAETLFRQWFIEEAKEDWEEVRLEEIADIGIGRTPPRTEFHWFSKNQNPNNIKWISIKDLGNDGVYISKVSEYLTSEAINKFKIPIIPKDTVVLSFKMTIGRVAITEENMVSNEAIAHFKLDKQYHISNEYLYIFLKNYQYKLLDSTSSIVTSINSRMIRDIRITIPDENILLKFNNIVTRYFNKIQANQQHIQTLTTLRDTLLPKLMSGEVRVKSQVLDPQTASLEFA